MSVRITGVGSGLPSNEVDNTHFEYLGVSDSWIRQRTGIQTRHHLHDGESLLELALCASTSAIATARVSAEDLDFVVVATSTPDNISPGVAPGLVHRLGAPSVGAVDVNGACTGFLYALDYAVAKLEQGSADRVLVVGADAMTRLTDKTDRNTAPLFGDGAGAVVLEASASECGLCAPSFSFGSAGAHAQDLVVPRDTPRVVMNGAEVYVHAVEEMSESFAQLMAANGTEPEEVDLLLCHQANSRILSAVSRRLSWDVAKAPSTVEKFGNTSAASIPLTLADCVAEGRVGDGARLGLVAFGAGFSWGSALMTWRECVHAKPKGTTLSGEHEHVA